MTDFHVVTFGSKGYERHIDLQRRGALRFGAASHVAYAEDSAPVQAARRENPDIFDHQRGYGYWLWKPYILRDALARVEGDGYVVYLDAGITPIADMRPWFECMRPHPVAFHAPTEASRLGQWCKRDCFILMDADTPTFWNLRPISAGIQAHRQSEESAALLAAWRHHMHDPRLLTDQANTQGLPNLPGFRGHRHDQSILTILAAQHRIPILREPTQYGFPTQWSRAERALPGGRCPQVLDVHRAAPGLSEVRFNLWRLYRRYVRTKAGAIAI
jgi:hypothetical protein